MRNSLFLSSDLSTHDAVGEAWAAEMAAIRAEAMRQIQPAMMVNEGIQHPQKSRRGWSSAAAATPKAPAIKVDEVPEMPAAMLAEQEELERADGQTAAGKVETRYTASGTPVTNRQPVRQCRVHPRTLDEVCEQRQPLEWLVYNVIPREGIGFLYGESGAGKSFVGIELMYQIAGAAKDGSSKFMGQDVEQAPVVYCCLEGKAGFEKRIQAYKQERGGNPKDAILIEDKITLDPKQEIHYAGVHDIAMVTPERSLVIIDTFSQATEGLNQNGPEDMGPALGSAQWLCEYKHCCVIIIGHTGKAIEKGLAGWQGLKNNADFHLRVSNDEKNNCKVLELAKAKDEITGLQATFTLKVVEVGVDSKGRPERSCVCVFGEEMQLDDKKSITAKGPRLTDDAKVLLNLLHELVKKEQEKGLPLPEGQRQIRIPDELLSEGFKARNPIDLTQDEATQKKQRDKVRQAYVRGRKALVGRNLIGIENRKWFFPIEGE